MACHNLNPKEYQNTQYSVLTCPKYSHTAHAKNMLLVLLAVMFKCRCSNCSGQDRCATAVGCFTIINHTTGGARQTEKGCFANTEEYRVQCTSREGNKYKVECCKQDMCNDFTISDESNGKVKIS